MSRFAALLGPGAGQPYTSRRVAADLARRTGQPSHRWGSEGIQLWQAGTSVARSFGPLTLAGDLALTDLGELRAALAADRESVTA